MFQKNLVYYFTNNIIKFKTRFAVISKIIMNEVIGIYYLVILKYTIHFCKVTFIN